MFSCLGAGVVLVLAFGAPINGQFGPATTPKREPLRPQGKVETLRTTAKIHGIQGDVLFVVDEEGQRWAVKMPSEVQDLHLVADAHLNWLRPGIMVRFTGEFDSKGKAQAPIDKLEAFTLRQPRQGEIPERVGVFREDAFGGGELFAGEGADGQSEGEVTSYVVIGQLRGLRDGEMFVAAGPALVRTPLAEDAKLSVDLADFSWVRVGDEAEIVGWYYPYLKGRAQATRLTIRSAKPIGFVPKEEPDKATPKPPTTQKKPPTEDLPF
jgi:hypothetical protein